MSAHLQARRLSVPDLKSRKGGVPIVALTAYTSYMARLVDEVADLILIGDSLGMVAHGYGSTVPVTLDMMIMHGKAVVNATQKALVAVDLPFGAYEMNAEQAFQTSVRVLKETGCTAVKVEGGARMADTIHFLVTRGIPVIGHIGLAPQSIHVLGSFKAQGRDEADWPTHINDAKAVDDAGAFAMVVEAVAEPLAQEITKTVSCPTIGIGASNQCDGQILVLEDMLGLTERVPKFVRLYAHLKENITQALDAYATDVKCRKFPSEAQTYTIQRQK